jgi:hypothetical protein
VLRIIFLGENVYGGASGGGWTLRKSLEGLPSC